MEKIFGYKTLGSLIFGLAFAKIISPDKFIFLAVAICVCILAVLFIPLIIFRHDGLRIISLNPFGTRFSISYKDISKVTIYAGNIHCKLTLHMHNGNALTTNSFFRYYDMEGLYHQFRDMNIPVTSTGVRAVSWDS